MKIGQTPDMNAALAPAGPQKAAKSPSPAPAAKEGTAASAAPTAASTTASASAAGVPVTVSPFARALEKNSQAGDFNADRVRAVRAAIDNGSYKVDAEAIADKLLSNAREILGRARG